MQLTRLGPPGSERPAARTAESVVHDPNSPAADVDGASRTADGIGRARAAAGSGGPPRPKETAA